MLSLALSHSECCIFIFSLGPIFDCFRSSNLTYWIGFLWVKYFKVWGFPPLFFVYGSPHT